MSDFDEGSAESYADWTTPYLEAGLLPSSVDVLFWGFKQACVASASSLSVPDDWVASVSTYLSQSTTPADDVEKILAGSRRSPSYYSGGLVLSLNSNAGAMTLDDCVFVGSGNWDPNTYVHEMVHVGQYGAYGIEGFLAAYFGSSAIEIVRRWAKGESTDVMTASYLETEAYAIGNRYDPANAR
jgi:hypothetical protein